MKITANHNIKNYETGNLSLINLLNKNYDEIKQVWVAKLKEFLQDDSVSFKGGVEGVVGSYLSILADAVESTGNEEKWISSLKKIFLSTREAKLDLLQKKKSIMMGKDVIYPFLEKEFRDDSSLLIKAMQKIDSCLYETIYQISRIEIAEREQLEKELEKTRQYFENLIESSIDALIATDMKGKITYFSKGGERILGYKGKEVIGKPMSTYYLRGPEEARKLMKILWTKGKVGNFEARMIAKNNEIFSMNLSVSFIRDTKGQPVGTLGVCRDLTEIKKLEHQIQQSEKLAALGQLSAGFAHEIGTPLNVISGTAEYLMKDMNKDNPMLVDLETIESQAGRIINLVQQFLVSARYREPDTGPVNINALLREVLRFTELQTSVKKISIVTKFNPNLPEVTGDSHQLQQVFLNLTINAIHALKQGGILTIRTNLLPPGSLPYIDNRLIEITFYDTGCGIPEKNLQKIFDPFFTTKEIGKGTGLGLTVSHRIIENHRGIIEVESQPGRGTSFFIKLPVN